MGAERGRLCIGRGDDRLESKLADFARPGYLSWWDLPMRTAGVDKHRNVGELPGQVRGHVLSALARARGV